MKATMFSPWRWPRGGRGMGTPFGGEPVAQAQDVLHLDGDMAEGVAAT